VPTRLGFEFAAKILREGAQPLNHKGNGRPPPSYWTPENPAIHQAVRRATSSISHSYPSLFDLSADYHADPWSVTDVLMMESVFADRLYSADSSHPVFASRHLQSGSLTRFQITTATSRVYRGTIKRMTMFEEGKLLVEKEMVLRKPARRSG
ncbi:hypothetical protein BaRGS_00018368, partial [Batillaria attramentaria]